jgi:hypothetical protein
MRTEGLVFSEKLGFVLFHYCLGQLGGDFELPYFQSFTLDTAREVLQCVQTERCRLSSSCNSMYGQ